MLKRATIKPQPIKQQDTLWYHVLGLLKNPWYCASQLFIALLSFGYYITNFTLGSDALSGERYVSGEMLAQGRMTWTLLGRLFRLYDHQPFFDAAFGICLLLALVTLLCAFFRLVTKERISVYACMTFGGLFISYPLVVEAWHFLSLIFFTTGGALMAFGALYALYRANTKAQLTKAYVVATFLLMLVASLYESVLICYVFLVFAYLLLTLRYKIEPKTVRELLLKGLRYALPLVIAIVLETLVSNTLINLLGLEPSPNSATSILWTASNIRECLKAIIYGFLDRIVIHSLIYLPLGVLVGAMVVMFVYGAVDVVRHKPKMPLVLCYAGLFICLILLSLIQAMPSYYRTLQVFSYFVAFTGLLLVQSTLETKRKALCGIVAICISFLVYHQAGDTNRWFVLNHRNYEQEQVTINRIGATLQAEFDIQNKPVVFTGGYKMASNISQGIDATDPGTVALVNRLRSLIYETPAQSYMVVETSVRNVIGWCTIAFDSNEELIKYFNYFGYTLMPVTTEQQREADAHATTLPAWPKNGSICDMGDYIIVNFGE